MHKYSETVSCSPLTSVQLLSQLPVVCMLLLSLFLLLMGAVLLAVAEDGKSWLKALPMVCVSVFLTCMSCSPPFPSFLAVSSVCCVLLLISGRQ